MKTLMIASLLFFYVSTIMAKPSNVVKTKFFNASLVFSSKLFAALPYVQRELLMSELEDRTIRAGERHFITGNIEFLQTAPAQTAPEYAQLVKDLYGLESSEKARGFYDQKIFGLHNLWKVNMQAIMPHTATLKKEDFINAAEHRDLIGDQVALASLHIAARGYHHILEAFKNLNSEQIAELLLQTRQNLALSDGKDSLISRFNKDLLDRKESLANQQEYVHVLGFLTKPQDKLPIYAEKALQTIDKHKQSLAQIEEVAALAIQAEEINTDMLAEFYAKEDLARLGDITIPSYNFVTRNGANKVAAALIADLSLAGYTMLSHLSIWDTTDTRLLSAVATALATPPHNIQ